MAMIELLGDLAVNFGQPVYEKQLEVTFMHYLENTAAAVREMGISKVKAMATMFKADWIAKFL